MKTAKNTKIDFVNLFVILVSLGLIVTGFWLIDQKNAKSQTANSSKSSSLNSIDKSNLFVNSSNSLVAISSQSSLAKSYSSLSLSSAVSSFSAIASQSTISSTTSVAPIQTVSSSSVQPIVLETKSSLSSSNSNLQNSQALVKVNTIKESGGYLIEVLDTGYINGRYWKKGAKLNIDTTVPLSLGSQYNISGISETSETVDFGLITRN